MFPKHSRSRAADTGLEMVMTKAANTNKQDLQECVCVWGGGAGGLFFLKKVNRGHKTLALGH